MRRARLVCTAIAVLSLTWSATIVRGDQGPHDAKGRRHGGIIAATHIEDFIDSALGGEEGDAEDGPAGGQAETSVAVDSTGQHIVISFNDTRGFTEDPVSLSGFMYSDDGGA